MIFPFTFATVTFIAMGNDSPVTPELGGRHAHRHTEFTKMFVKPLIMILHSESPYWSIGSKYIVIMAEIPRTEKGPEGLGLGVDL